MVASKAIEEQIKVNRRIIGRLKREIFGVDKTHRSRYIKEFNLEFKMYEATTTAEDVIERASRCDIVYFGDYHPLDASQDFVLRLMREFSARGRSVVLALEMLYVHQQEFLDRWMKGTMDDAAFLEAIDYRSEWGFSWPSYRRIFDLARDPFIPVFGIDSEMRDHLRSIRRRDRLAARRIGTIRAFFPDSLILVVVGESHLASNHLPREVHAALARDLREIIIVQNMDDIYWSLLRKGREDAEAVAIDANRYCVFTASPMLKYEAYRNIIDVWVEGEEVDRHTPFLHEAIDAIQSFLANGGKKRLVSLPNGRMEPFDAVLPEVQCRATYHAFSSYLRSRRVSTREIVRILQNLKRDGMSYVPSINTCLIVKFDPSIAVREAARFVLHAARGDILERRAGPLEPEDDFLGTVIADSLVCFASRIVDSSRDCAKYDPLIGSLEAGGAVTLDGILRLGAKKRFLVAKALGARLGDALHTAHHEGRLTRSEIAGLFRMRLDAPGASRDMYNELLEKTGGGVFLPLRRH
ncbi:MAG: ChaN family lipoprotein [Candidatus Krumholzibacteria bacterium]|nr:ChaN family lipoprotein [Candidatus Krumholzibacteria bacterium]